MATPFQGRRPTSNATEKRVAGHWNRHTAEAPREKHVKGPLRERRWNGDRTSRQYVGFTHVADPAFHRDSAELEETL